MLITWTPDFVPNKVVIFGCGGTGSRVVPLVAQFLKSCPWVIDPELVLVDFDEVETKNLLRQNFIASDVGKNKALVLARRYSKAFNISIVPITTRLTHLPETEEEKNSYATYSSVLLTADRRNIIYILCVDSPEARREIMQTVLRAAGSSSQFVIIDSGNENDFGQVTISSGMQLEGDLSSERSLKELKQDSPVSMTIPMIPLDTSYYQDMEKVDTPSCADLDQTMAINTLMAVNIFALIQNIYYVKPISYNRINVSMQHGANPQYINPSTMLDVVKTTCKGNIFSSITRTFSCDSQISLAVQQQRKFIKDMEKMVKDEEERIRKETEIRVEEEVSIEENKSINVDDVKDLGKYTTNSIKKKRVDATGSAYVV